MRKFLFWQRWLFIVSLIVFVFGILMAFLSGTVFFDAFDNQINPIFWKDAEVDKRTADFQHWIYGVLGSTMAGWGIILIFISSGPFKKREKWSWNCIFLAILLWYLVDTAISLYFGVNFNAVFNTMLFVLVMLPLVFTRKQFDKQGD